MSEEKAISVIDEAWNTYFGNFKDLSEPLKKKISLHMLDHIFRYMVRPAIDKARALDREGREQQKLEDSNALCSDCPPEDYPTDKTRCLPCPRRADVSGLVERSETYLRDNILLKGCSQHELIKDLFSALQTRIIETG